jgi:small multidrug resistance family-3 protein
VREHRGLLWIGAGIAALGVYGFVATLQPDATFGRILAAYGGVFVVGSLGWGVIVDKFRPDRYDIAGAAICLLGVAVIMDAPARSPARVAVTPGRDRIATPNGMARRAAMLQALRCTAYVVIVPTPPGEIGVVCAIGSRV